MQIARRVIHLAALLVLVSTASAGCAALRIPAKTTVADAAMEEFSSLHELLEALPSDADMRARHPSLRQTPGRVEQEQRNVSVEAWVYAASEAWDFDYHMVLGSAPEEPAEFMTAEITWVPSGSPQRDRLLAVRRQFISIFGQPPRLAYSYLRPPVHVRVSGSLFYDIDHRPGHVGPSEYASHTAWEIHPVTSIRAISQREAER